MSNETTNYAAPAWKGLKPVSVRFGERLHQLRTDRGYTQIQFAMAAKLDRSFISDMERGVKEPTVSTLERIANAFSLTLAEFFEGV